MRSYTVDDMVMLALPDQQASHLGRFLPKKSGEGALPHQPLHLQVHFIGSPKTKKIELHIGLHLKSVEFAAF